METAALVIGAGPTGLTVAALLGAAGIATHIVEAKPSVDMRVRAIGVSPPSLEVLDRLGVSAGLIEQGTKVSRAHVFDLRRRVGAVSFSGIASAYPFILSVAQGRTEACLRSAVERRPGVTLETDFRVSRVSEAPNAQRDSRRDSPRNTLSGDTVYEVRDEANRVRRGRAVFVCSGASSALPDQLQNPLRLSKRYRLRFLIGDYPDDGVLGDDAALVFTPHGSVESFPLSGEYRRWVVQLPTRYRNSALTTRAADALLRTLVGDRGGALGATIPASGEPLWWSSFQPQRRERRRFRADNIFFVGDAAHTMSPIGGQGMNTGIADAELAADIFIAEQFNRGPLPLSLPLPDYCRQRRRAFRSAANRAALSMAIGTASGTILSSIRSGLLATALAVLPDTAIASHFAMLTIPYRRSALGGRAEYTRRNTDNSIIPEKNVRERTSRNPCEETNR